MPGYQREFRPKRLVHLHVQSTVHFIAMAPGHLGRGRLLVADARKRLPAWGLARAPAASGPLGGGLLKLGHGSTAAALTVALAPYALWTLLLSVFLVGYLAAVARCIWRTGDQEVMERMIMVSAWAVVSILTLTVPAHPARRPPPHVPEPPGRGTGEPAGARPGRAG
jgi:hypothetical protein